MEILCGSHSFVYAIASNVELRGYVRLSITSPLRRCFFLIILYSDPYSELLNSRYSSSLINFSSSFSVSPVNSTFATQPPPAPESSLALFIVPGFSSNKLLTSITLQVTGELMSEADFTDSTAPMASPAATSVSTAGSST